DEVRARRRGGADPVRQTRRDAWRSVSDRSGAHADGQGAGAVAPRRSAADAGLGGRLAGRAARSAAPAPYHGPRRAAPAAVPGAASSARRARARRLTPISMRSGGGAENDSRSVFWPSPFT